MNRVICWLFGHPAAQATQYKRSRWSVIGWLSDWPPAASGYSPYRCVRCRAWWTP